MRLVLFGVVLMVPLVAGCRHVDLRYAARARHAAEIRCSLDDVQAAEVGRGVFMAIGCHTTAVYVCDRRGACRLDGEVHRDQ